MDVGGTVTQARAHRLEDLAAPSAAEGGVKDHLHVLEITGNVTAAEVGDWRSPRGRVRRTRGDIARNAAAREEPDADRLFGPFHGVDATFGCVEACAVSSGATIGDLAAIIVGITRSACFGGHAAAEVLGIVGD